MRQDMAGFCDSSGICWTDIQSAPWLQIDNHTETSSLNCLQAGCSSWRPVNSVKALKAVQILQKPVESCPVHLCVSRGDWRLSVSSAGLLTASCRSGSRSSTVSPPARSSRCQNSRILQQSKQASAVANSPARQNRAVDRAWRSVWKTIVVERRSTEVLLTQLTDDGPVYHALSVQLSRWEIF